MRRQPKAREVKQKARIQAFYKLETSTKPRPSEVSLDLSNDGQQRLGNNILRMKNVSLKFGDRVMLEDFSYDFNKGDKIGLVGGNGVGKSSFARVLTGEQSIDKGVIDVGETVVFGSYNQMGIQWDDDEMRVLDFVKQKVESRNGSTLAESPQEAMKLLNQFQFQRARWNER
jgi:ATP-binding cassette subfamily F protein uup